MGITTKEASALLSAIMTKLLRPQLRRAMPRAARIGAISGLSALLTLTSACARSTDTSAVNERAAAADTQPARISMAELQKRILAYADSLRSRADISPDKFGTAIGVSFVPDEKVSIRHIAKDLTTTDGYNYGVTSLSVESAREFPNQEVIFYQLGKQPVTDAPNGVCYWEAESAGRALEALGYRTGAEVPFQRGGIRQYRRPITGGNQGMDTSLLTYRSDEGDTARTCVYAVQFGGGDR
ncbi:hypothetical protein [Stenotrophomonas sp. T8]|jgi:hypothetical protein